MSAAQNDTAEWTRIGRVDWIFSLVLVAPICGLIATTPMWLSHFFSRDPGVRLAIGALLLVVGVGAWALVARLRTPFVWIDETTQRVRSGRRTLAWRELTSAELVVAANMPRAGRSLLLLLRGAGGVRIPIALRRRDRLVLTSEQTALVVRMIEASRITMPRADEDPEGRFSRWNFPQNISKEDAMRTVMDPPTKGQPLPTPS